MNKQSGLFRTGHRLVAAIGQIRHKFLVILVGASLSGCAYECLMQYRDTQYIHSVALDAVRGIDAADKRAQVIAIRDYIRSKVTSDGAPFDDRPFFRASAAETMRSGKGYCGEVSRAFICISKEVGIKSQRIILWGKVQHVVAEAEVGPGDREIVDSQNPPHVVDLEPLDKVILRPEFDEYYTLNLRRLGLTSVVSRVKLEMGPLTYWAENPHALKALLWVSLGAAVLLLQFSRILVRVLLRKRGWVHSSTLRPDQQAIIYQPDAPASIQENRLPANQNSLL